MEPGQGQEADSPANPNGDSGGGLSDDPFAELQTIKIHGAVALRAPDREIRAAAFALPGGAAF